MTALLKKFCCWEELASRALLSENRRAYSLCFVSLLGLVAFLSVLVFLTGCVPQAVYPWDVAILLDGLSRLHHGQIIHVHFSTAMGIAYLQLLRLGTLFSGQSVNVFAYA